MRLLGSAKKEEEDCSGLHGEKKGEGERKRKEKNIGSTAATTEKARYTSLGQGKTRKK